MTRFELVGNTITWRRAAPPKDLEVVEQKSDKPDE